MRRSDNRAALTDEVARFQAEVQRVALVTVRAVIRQELDRKLAKPKPARPRARKPGRAKATASPRERAPESSQLVLPGTDVSQQPPDPLALVPPPAAASESSPGLPPDRRKRVPWTRETIINELATWMSKGSAIDATFVTRHGPPGLVAATRRVFGRFEAALNVAALQVSKQNPDGPPAR